MTMWLSVLIAVAVAVALFALGGARPRGGRPVERTQLMVGARIALLVLVLVIAWAAWNR
jgi:hypothetical protein